MPDSRAGELEEVEEEGEKTEGQHTHSATTWCQMGQFGLRMGAIRSPKGPIWRRVLLNGQKDVPAPQMVTMRRNPSASTIREKMMAQPSSSGPAVARCAGSGETRPSRILCSRMMAQNPWST